MSNLVVDQGNTRTKAAIFEGHDLVEVCTSGNDSALRMVEQLHRKYSAQKGILSSVTHQVEVWDFLQNNISASMQLDAATPLPFHNSYGTPQTLGKDRLAAIAGAFHLKPQHSSLVIDAGTAITYDFIHKNGTYQGGSIAPGLHMRFKALHQFTSKLPLVEADPNLPITGSNTVSSINSGVYFGMLHEIDGFISNYRKYDSDLFVFLTGGDAHIFEKNIKNSIFVAPNLVLSGLNSLLEYNNAE